MKGKNKYLDCAINVMDENNFIPIDVFENFDSDFHQIMPNEMIEFKNPEFLAILKQEEEIKRTLFNSLSQEAKEIVDIIINSPAEIMSFLSYGHSKNITSIKKLVKQLYENWGDREIVDSIIQEVATYSVKVNVL